MRLNQVLRKGSTGQLVKQIQQKLKEHGHYTGAIDGDFGPNTEKSVMAFQNTRPNLSADGVVGNLTWKSLHNVSEHRPAIIEGTNIKDYHLNDGEFFADVREKKQLYIHHTAGSRIARFVVDGWESDKRRKVSADGTNELEVATAFVIGGHSERWKTTDGEILRAFPEYYWAHHLGTKRRNNFYLNAHSIGIEICSYGGLIENRAGEIVTTYGQSVKDSEIYDHGTKFRGYRYFQKYTDAQLESLRKLILQLEKQYPGLEIKRGIYNTEWFEYNEEAATGERGLWTHTNVRKDKSDCFPQPELIQVLNSL
jgi:N-acetyl-anhydromuramyl-L-alanine amidase AmpD